MKCAGIIGGIGPESTIDYYRLIISEYRKLTGSGEYPSILINSIDMTGMLRYVETGDLGGLADFLLDEIGKLKKGGADFAVLASNTPHIVFDRLRDASPLLLVSIVEEAARYAVDKGLIKLGLFGTRFTMQGGFYQSVFLKAGIEIVTPDQDAREFIHDKYMNELVAGVFLEDTKMRLKSIAEAMAQESGIQGLILGGTELPLILKEQDFPRLPLLNTTAIHVQRIVRLLTGR